MWFLGQCLASCSHLNFSKWVRSRKWISFHVWMCFVPSDVGLKFWFFKIYCFFLLIQGKLFLIDISSHTSLIFIFSPVVPLPHLHVCCSFSFQEEPSGFLKQDQTLTLSFHKALSVISLWRFGILLPFILINVFPVPTNFKKPWKIFQFGCSLNLLQLY